MGKDKKFHLHDSIGYRLTYAARLSERRFEALIEPTGLTRLAWCVLCAVEYERLARPSDIAAYVGVDRAVLSRLMRRMEAEGFLTRALSSADGRGRMVAATDRGRAALKAATAASRDNSAHFNSLLTVEERAVMERVLNRFLAAGDAPLSGL